jgi:hypothetical protein
MAEGQPDEQPWLSLTEAAARTGRDREAIRARARRGLIPYRQGNRGQWLVQLPADLMAAPNTAEHAAEADLVADLQAEVAELRLALARAEAARDTAKAAAVAEMAAEVAEARREAAVATAKFEERERAHAAEVTAVREFVAELRALLADARRPWWQRWRSATARP